MGLLDRYGVGSPETESEAAGARNNSNNDSEREDGSKLSNAIIDPYEEVKVKIHNAIVEQQISSGASPTDEIGRASCRERV